MPVDNRPATMPPVRIGPLPEGYTHSPHHNCLVRNDLVVTGREDGRIIHRDHAFRCTNCNEYICVNESRSDYSVRLRDVDCHWCNNCAEDHAFQGEDGRYYLNEPEGRGISTYHHGVRLIDPVSSAHPFLIGFEIEKEDAVVRDGLANRKPGFALPEGWAAERDSSLNMLTGFEVITRAYNLSILDRMREDMDKAAFVADAGFSRTCGGHINISDARYVPSDFAKRIRPLFPLLMALYPKRLAGQYARGKKIHDVGADKYCAVRYTGGRIELRCPSAVKSLKNLKWRLDLVTHFMLASRNAPLDWRWMKRELAMGGTLRTMLAKAYCKNGSEANDPTGAAHVKRVMQLYRAFSVWFYTNKEPNDIIRVYLGYKPLAHIIPQPEYPPTPVEPPFGSPRAEVSAYREAYRVWEQEYNRIYEAYALARRRANAATDQAVQALLAEAFEDQLV